ncbi:hypothetical protein DEO72_LG6g1437 [Vigna unguiculata]|uniref:Uncharacterized protein n=1 Tax=Vigna unguiculata TaxID=3917 RepID=A0A4D6M895_VIGUN|nr:hypothetical protein DEO72_LG6g1436 [Vigna unguiculata]QCD96728.1 hypothetical protein DEO72_LG6g1437 [Vigna unguiculata]
MHIHTGNTRQPEPQLKSSSCSSAILSHNLRDAIPSHNSRNVMCLTLILSHNSRNLTSRPSRYHQSFVDHAHPKQTKLMPLHHRLALPWSCHAKLASRSPAGDTCLEAPSASNATISTSIAWRDNPYRQAPCASIPTYE